MAKHLRLLGSLSDTTLSFLMLLVVRTGECAKGADRWPNMEKKKWT